MERQQDNRRATVEATPAPAPMIEAPAPAAPVPMAVGTMTVGHAEDHAEKDADQRADSALRRLRALDPDAHRHGPGCDHVRRSAGASSSGALVGYEGGALDGSTTADIESRRGGGRAIDDPVLRRMQTAFSADFSGVRIHDDADAARLNRVVSARAFTTGKDIFFGAGEYAPSTTAGERVLAHELAHTLQPATATHRTVDPRARGVGTSTGPMVRRGMLDWFRKKKVAQDPDAEGAVAAPVAAAPAAAASAKYAGPAGGIDDTKQEIAKPLVAAGVDAPLAIAGATQGALYGAGEALGGLLTVDSQVGLNKANSIGNDANEFSDAGMRHLTDRKWKNQGQALAHAAGSGAKSAVQTAYLTSGQITSTKDVAVGVGNAALGATAGALGVAVGSAQVLQGAYKGGKAVQKLWRLKRGKAADMLSARGKKWKSHLVDVEWFKLAVAGMKMTLGALGIAVGALLIVSNPIGWTVGVAAAILGGAYAATKVYGKIKNASERAKAAEDIENGQSLAEVAARLGAEPVAEAGAGADDVRPFDAPDPAPARAKMQGQGPVRPVPQGDGRTAAVAKKVADKQGGKPDKKTADERRARTAAIEKGNAIARRASEKARIAGEMRNALSAGNADRVERALKGVEAGASPMSVDLFLEAHHDRELHDAFLLLQSINVSDEEALSESGQDLIEKKLSKTEAM